MKKRKSVFILLLTVLSFGGKKRASALYEGSGNGLLVKDGGIFKFGDASYCRSTGSVNLNRSIVNAKEL